MTVPRSLRLRVPRIVCATAHDEPTAPLSSVAAWLPRRLDGRQISPILWHARCHAEPGGGFRVKRREIDIHHFARSETPGSFPRRSIAKGTAHVDHRHLLVIFHYVGAAARVAE